LVLLCNNAVITTIWRHEHLLTIPQILNQIIDVKNEKKKGSKAKNKTTKAVSQGQQ